MKKIILTKGLPGSGKSTWARSVILEHPNSYKRVNKDDLREMLDCGQWSRDAEKLIMQLRDMLVIEALKTAKNVIVDDTNFAPKHEARMREIAKAHGAELEVRFFDTPVEECIARDLKRANSVGESVIRQMYNQYLRPKPTPPKIDDTLPWALLCDLDGTLALLNGRSPYDASTCEQDILNPPVAAILRKQNLPVILMSGREDKHRTQTERWLAVHSIDYAALWMRSTGDKRKDAIIKQELYEAHVLGKYNILFVLDDRNQVVELWRRLGLTCLQVAEGAF